MKIPLTISLLVANSLLLAPAKAGEADHPSAEEKGMRWQTDQPGFRVNLTYPIGYTLAFQGVGAASLTLFGDEERGYSGLSVNNFVDAFTKGPRPDNDQWYLNYLGHPLWGSETYLRSRAQGCSPLGSLLFAAVASTVWEFGIESWYHRPSSQDLIITPLAGAVIGEVRFHAKRALLNADTSSSRALAVAIDPIQSAVEVIGHAFGQDWSEPAFRKISVNASQSAPVFTASLTSAQNRLALAFQCRISF
jgi:hypothetical protein